MRNSICFIYYLLFIYYTTVHKTADASQKLKNITIIAKDKTINRCKEALNSTAACGQLNICFQIYERYFLPEWKTY